MCVFVIQNNNNNNNNKSFYLPQRYTQLYTLYSVSQKMSQVWLDITLTHIYQFLQFLAHVTSRDSEIGCVFNFLKYLAFTYFIMLWIEMTGMTRCPRHCYSVTGVLCTCVKMVFSADDKVSIKSLYQFSGGLVQTFNENFISSGLKTIFTQRSRDAITVTHTHLLIQALS